VVDGEVRFDALPDEDPPEDAEGGDAVDGDGTGEAYEESRAESVADAPSG
jgi:hypothetical protein